MLQAADSEIEKKIFTIRGLPVMIDRDLAGLYNVETKRLNEQVKRNSERFPKEFRFQLTVSEKDELVANCDRFQTLKYSSSLPYVFTEQGVSMLSAVLKSDVAVKVSIDIINTFVKMRRILSINGELFQRLALVEKRQIANEIKTDSALKRYLMHLKRRLSNLNKASSLMVRYLTHMSLSLS